MKKSIQCIIVSLVLAVSAILFIGCSKSVTVTLELDGGSYGYSSLTVESGDCFTLDGAPTKEGCFFEGWWTAPQNGKLYDFSQPVTSDIKLFARWSINDRAVVSFDMNLPEQGVAFDNVPSDLILRAGEKFTLPSEPIADGYVFKGWYTTVDYSERVDNSTVITDNITLYAKWTKLCIVSFESGLGVAPNDMRVEIGTVAKLPDVAVDGYTLGEWCTDVELTVPYDETSLITGDVKLYAKFYKHTPLDCFYFGEVERDGYARITGIKPDKMQSIGDTLVIPSITATGEKIGRFSVLNTSGTNAVDLSSIKKVVLSDTLNKGFSEALDLMPNLQTIVGGRSGRDYNAYAGCAYRNEDDAYMRLYYVPKNIKDKTVVVRNDGIKTLVECDAFTGEKFNGLGIAGVKYFEICGVPSDRLQLDIQQNINVVILAPDEYLQEYSTLYAKKFVYGENGDSGVLAFVPTSERDNEEYIQNAVDSAVKARDEEIKRQQDEILGRN